LDPLYTPSVDAVQEFKIQQSNFSAEIGFTGSTVINMVTRSGTNEFHGSAYEFLRNNVLTANNWFSNASNTPLPARRYNLFGGTIGGPIKRDKTFFFFNYEGTRDVNAASFRAGVPSVAMRQGDFSELCAVGFNPMGDVSAKDNFGTRTPVSLMRTREERSALRTSRSTGWTVTRAPEMQS
jgi:hypothetical protein